MQALMRSNAVVPISKRMQRKVQLSGIFHANLIQFLLQRAKQPLNKPVLPLFAKPAPYIATLMTNVEEF